MKTERSIYYPTPTANETHQLSYRLLRTKRCSTPEYYISVRLEQEQKLAYVGTDHALALSLYDMIVQGEVTPCTLQDIVEDALFETVRTDFASAYSMKYDVDCVNMSK